MSAAMEWVTGNDTGTSSKAIWSHMMTGAVSDKQLGVGHPHDCDDFGRCYRLLVLVPEWRPRIGEMAKYSAEWKALAENWSALSSMYFAADSQRGDWKKWKPMYEAMSKLLTAARVCADCGVVGMNAWSTSPGDVKRCSDCAEKHRGAA